MYIYEGLTLTTINVWVCHTYTSYMYSHFRMFLRFLLHVLFCILHPSPYLNEHYQRSIMNFSQYKYQILRKNMLAKEITYNNKVYYKAFSKICSCIYVGPDHLPSIFIYNAK